jgi:ABC-2 type transport system ATP-binding protein
MAYKADERDVSVGQSPPAISAVGLRKRFGDVAAVDGIDLSIPSGQVVALLGPNGAGKSTTIDLFLGLTRADAGEVRLFGDPPRTAVLKGRIGAMLQDGFLLAEATVQETVAMIASLHTRALPVAEALRMAGVDDLAKRRCATLSGGQQQRVRFAITLVNDPDLLVLDEPTAAMDVAARRAFWESIRQFTDRGKTVLFATHYLDEAEEFADRVIFLRAGRVVADGSIPQIKAIASNRFIKASIPGADTRMLRMLPGVVSAEVRADQVELTCSNSDAAVQALTAHFPRSRDIEIRAGGLEETFLTLTQVPNAVPDIMPEPRRQP